MIIRDHILRGERPEERISFRESPNQSGAFEPDLPDTIVIHFTAGSSAESSVKWFIDRNARASAHLVVGRDKSITQLVPFDKIAWHAGQSAYKGREGFNKYAVGIEIDNAGLLKKTGAGYQAWFGKVIPESEVVEAVHRNESTPSFWHTYTEDQIALVFELCMLLMDTYRITTILGHEEISPHRKNDPGPAFPLDKLRERVLLRNRSADGPEDATPAREVGMVTSDKLNIRSRPSFAAATVAPPLTQGTIVGIRQELEGWYEVEVSTRGWVKKEYIKTTV